MEGVVVGVDESPAAAAALRWAVRYGRAHALPVTATMAWSSRDQHSLDREEKSDLELLGADARRDLRAIVERALCEQAATVRQLAVEGSAADVLLATSSTAELLVVGARGTGRVKGLLLGSVSRGVLVGACCPVGVVRGDPVADTGPIVVGVDGSSTARAALRWAVDEARSRQCPLIALHAWHVTYAGHGYPEPHTDAMDSSAESVLRREIAAVDGYGLCAPVEPRLVQAFAGSALVAESAAASLLVVGVRGHRSLAGRVLGSVSDHVAQRAQCPVVVIPLEDEQPVIAS